MRKASKHRMETGIKKGRATEIKMDGCRCFLHPRFESGVQAAEEIKAGYGGNGTRINHTTETMSNAGAEMRSSMGG